MKLPWREYNTLLRAALKSAAKKPVRNSVQSRFFLVNSLRAAQEQTRPLVKLVLGIIGAFHFDASVEPEDGAAEKGKEKEKVAEKKKEKENEKEAEKEKGDDEEEGDEDEEDDEAEVAAAQLDKGTC